MNIMNVLSTGMDVSISRIHVWLCNNKQVFYNLIWFGFIVYQPLLVI